MSVIKDETAKQHRAEHFWPDIHLQQDVEGIWCGNKKKSDASAILFLRFSLPHNSRSGSPPPSSPKKGVINLAVGRSSGVNQFKNTCNATDINVRKSGKLHQILAEHSV